MKNFLLLAFIPFLSFAQVGINTPNPNADAMLDVVSSDSGVLIPRVNLEQTTSPAPLSTDVAGMILYNLATVNDVTPGFYYNDGATWIRISGASNTDWSVLGNTGTVASTNFLGTTDNTPLTLRVNDVEKVRLETNGTISTLNVGNGVYIGEGAGANELFVHPVSPTVDENNINTFVGHNAGHNNTVGDRNNAFGNGALLLNTTGTNNNAIGVQSLSDNTDGSHNTALGNLSLTDNISGVRNQAFGNQALRENTNGNRNIGIGYAAGRNNLIGNNNVAVGRYALGTNEDGNNNTALGKDAYFLGDIDGAVSSWNNSTAIGFNAQVAGSNEIRLGNTSVSTITGQVAFASPSDKRIKDNITEDVVGLDFIKKLRPVTYNFNVDRQNALMGVNSEDFEGKYDIEKIKMTGFIAQEIEAAAKESNFDFSGVRVPTGDRKLYSVAYSEFVVPLVKAVQEQQEMIESQQETIETLKAQIALINEKLDNK